MRKKITLKTAPCGVPSFASNISDDEFCWEMLKYRFCRKDRNHNQAFPLILWVRANLYNNPFLHILSKAFSISRKTTGRSRPLTNAYLIRVINSIKHSRVEIPGLKPNWNLLI